MSELVNKTCDHANFAVTSTVTDKVNCYHFCYRQGGNAKNLVTKFSSIQQILTSYERNFRNFTQKLTLPIAIHFRCFFFNNIPTLQPNQASNVQHSLFSTVEKKAEKTTKFSCLFVIRKEKNAIPPIGWGKSKSQVSVY